MNRLGRLDMSINNFARVAQISSGEMASRLNGKKPLHGELASRLLRLVSALEDLQRSKNVPVEWGDTDFIRLLLAQRAESRAAIQMVLEEAI